MNTTLIATLFAAGVSLSACGNINFIDPKGSFTGSIDETGKPELKLDFGFDFEVVQEALPSTIDADAPSINIPSDDSVANETANKSVPEFGALTDNELTIHSVGGSKRIAAAHYEANNIRYAFAENTVRKHPVDHEIMAELSQIVARLGSDLTIVVNSGGQHKKGQGPRVGSTRHDMNEHGFGQAVDFVLIRQGRPLLPADNLALYADLIEQAAKSFAGIGHYSWGLHVGHGSPAFWGPDRTAATASPILRRAYLSGRAAR